MTFAEIELRNRVAHLESAVLKLCASTMNLVQVVDPQPQKGSHYLPTKEEKDAAVRKAVEYLREAAEIVSGEHAPR